PGQTAPLSASAAAVVNISATPSGPAGAMKAPAQSQTAAEAAEAKAGGGPVCRYRVPDELTDPLRSAKGVTLLAGEAALIRPAHYGRDAHPQVSATVAQFVNTHRALAANGRILAQRLTVRCVPVWQVDCEWAAQPFSFWVYSNDALVFET